MKKLILLFCISLLLISCGKTNASYYSAHRLNIQGDVKKIEQSMFDMDGEIVNVYFYDMGYRLPGNVEIEFNDNGDTELKIYDEYGNSTDRWTFEYDEDGYLVNESYGMFISDRSVYESETKNGKAIVKKGVVKATVYYDGEENDAEYVYKDGIQLEFYDYDLNGEVSFSVIYSIDKQNCIDEIEFYYNDGSIENVTLEYNKKGYLESYVDEYGDKFEFDYEYDSKDNWVEAVLEINGKELYTIERTYTYN